ncbi:MAG: DUF4190 domain-containing protein [Sporichthyaceae bacterium]|nr:DUF4190 domain-containing protein [Sporichthyaceae bacterium]
MSSWEPQPPQQPQWGQQPPPGQPPAYPPQDYHPPGYYRPEPRNGLGLAAVIVGGIGILFGLVPLTFWIAGPLALAAIVLGLAGRGRVRRGNATNGRMAVTGTILGVGAAALSMVGAVIVFGAFDQAAEDLDDALSGAGPCSEVLVVGQPIPEAIDQGCTEAGGGLTFPGIQDCADGRRLLTTDDAWGFLGEELHRGGADDTEFGDAFDACTG